MVDVVDRETRSRMMSGIRSENTKPEILLRKQLHLLGLRYRLHPKNFPGRPDMIFPKWGAVVFVHGCFWHWHGCKLSKIPETRKNFWKKKLADNSERDKRVISEITKTGWRCAVIWECALRGKYGRENLEAVSQKVASWIKGSKKTFIEIKGR